MWIKPIDPLILAKNTINLAKSTQKSSKNTKNHQKMADLHY